MPRRWRSASIAITTACRHSAKRGVTLEELRRKLDAAILAEAWDAVKIVHARIVEEGKRVAPGNVIDVGRGREASKDEILEDYPYLTPEDIEFAPVFTRAYPRMGRPRERQAPAR